MKRQYKLLLISSFFLVLLLPNMHGQRIQGRLVDDQGTPIPYATIFALPDSLYTVSDSSGRFVSFSDHFLVRALGYESMEVKNFDRGTTLQLTIDPLYLDQVVVNDLAIATRMQSFPGAIEKIDLIEIEQTNPNIITDLLNKTPGVYMQSGALNTNRITIRGIGSRSPFSTNKIRAYYDDIPLTNGSGETTIEDIDLTGIGSMEIIKGPNSSIYGSGLGGTINIKSRKPTLLQDRIFTDLSVGSFGTQKQSIGFGSSSDRHSLNVVLGRLQSDGYRDNNELDRYNGMLRASYNVNDTRFGLLAYYVDQKAFIPSSISEDAFNTDPTSAAFTWGQSRGFEDYYSYLVGLSFDRPLGSNLLIKSSLYHSGKDAYEPRPFNILDDETTSIGTRNRLIYDITSEFSAMVGFELFADQYQWATYDNLYNDLGVEGSVIGSQLSDLQEDRSYVNTFLQFDWNPSEKLFVTAGLNLNSTSYDLEDNFNPDSTSVTSDYTYDWQVSPRIGLSYELVPRMYWYASASHGFSPPSLEETLTPEGQVNSDIQPESGWNLETGWKGSTNYLNFDLSLYSMHIKNLLVARRIGLDQYVGINAGSTIHNGIEASVVGRWINLPELKVYNSINYTLSSYSFDKFIDDDNDFSGNDLTGVPANQLVIDGTVEYRDLYFLPRFTFVDEIPLDDANTIYSDSYQLLDLTLGWEKRLKDATIDISYQGANLLDETYASMVQINATGFGGRQPRYYYPGLPINHRIRLKISYQLKQR